MHSLCWKRTEGAAAAGGSPARPGRLANYLIITSPQPHLADALHTHVGGRRAVAVGRARRISGAVGLALAGVAGGRGGRAHAVVSCRAAPAHEAELLRPGQQ